MGSEVGYGVLWEVCVMADRGGLWRTMIDEVRSDGKRG